MTPAAHGTQKLFGWFGGPGLDGTGKALAMLGFQGRRHALMARLVEAGGGVLLALGFLTPGAAAVVLSVMFVAAVSAHIKQGFFITSGGYEDTLVLGVAGLTVAFTGPGALSIDALLGYSIERRPVGRSRVVRRPCRWRNPAGSAAPAPALQTVS